MVCWAIYMLGSLPKFILSSYLKLRHSSFSRRLHPLTEEMPRRSRKTKYPAYSGPSKTAAEVAASICALYRTSHGASKSQEGKSGPPLSIPEFAQLVSGLTRIATRLSYRLRIAPLWRIHPSSIPGSCIPSSRVSSLHSALLPCTWPWTHPQIT